MTETQSVRTARTTQKQKIDTPARRQKIYEYLNRNLDRSGNPCPASTWRIAQASDLTTRQVYRLLRRMEVDGLLRRDTHAPGIWHATPLSAHERLGLKAG